MFESNCDWWSWVGAGRQVGEFQDLGVLTLRRLLADVLPSAIAHNICMAI